MGKGNRGPSLSVFFTFASFILDPTRLLSSATPLISVKEKKMTVSPLFMTSHQNAEMHGGGGESLLHAPTCNVATPLVSANLQVFVLERAGGGCGTSCGLWVVGGARCERRADSGGRR